MKKRITSFLLALLMAVTLLGNGPSVYAAADGSAIPAEETTNEKAEDEALPATPSEAEPSAEPEETEEQPEEPAETAEAPELPETEAPEDGIPVSTPSEIAPMSRNAGGLALDLGTDIVAGFAGKTVNNVEIGTVENGDGANIEFWHGHNPYSDNVDGLNLSIQDGTILLSGNVPDLPKKITDRYTRRIHVSKDQEDVYSEQFSLWVIFVNEDTDYTESIVGVPVSENVLVEEAKKLVDTGNSLPDSIKDEIEYEYIDSIDPSQAGDGNATVKVTLPGGISENVYVKVRYLADSEKPVFTNDDGPIFLMEGQPVVDDLVQESAKIKVTDNAGIKLIGLGHERLPDDSGYKTNIQDFKGTTVRFEVDGNDSKTAYAWYGIAQQLDPGEVDWSKKNLLRRSLIATDFNNNTADSKTYRIVVYNPSAAESTITKEENDDPSVTKTELLDNVNLSFYNYTEKAYEGTIQKEIKSVVKDGDNSNVPLTGETYNLERDLSNDTDYTVTVTVTSDWGQTKDVAFTVKVKPQKLETTQKNAAEAIDQAAKAKKEAIDNSDMTDAEKDAAKAEVDSDTAAAKEAIAQANNAAGVETAKNAGLASIQADKSKLETEYAKKDEVQTGDGYTEADTEKQTAYNQALTEAEAVLANAQANQEAIDKALDNLEEAKAALNGGIEIQPTSENIELVRGVEKTVKFYYTDGNNHVKSAGFVGGGNQPDNAFNPNTEITLGKDANGKYVEVTFKLPKDFADGNFPDKVTPEEGGKWTKYLALYDGEGKTGKILNATGSDGQPSMLTLVVKTQAGAYTPSLPTKVVVNDAASLTSENIKAVEEAVKKANENAPWYNSATITADASNVTITYEDGTSDTLPIRDFVDDSKAKAKKAIDDAAQAKKEAIDNSDMTDAEKDAAKAEVDSDTSAAKEAIAQADNAAGVETAKNAGLAAIEVDKSLLQAEVDKEKTVTGSIDYTNADEANKKAYDTALAEAKALLADDKADQKAIDSALLKLQEAKDAFFIDTDKDGDPDSSDPDGDNDGILDPGYTTPDKADKNPKVYDELEFTKYDSSLNEYPEAGSAFVDGAKNNFIIVYGNKDFKVTAYDNGLTLKTQAGYQDAVKLYVDPITDWKDGETSRELVLKVTGQALIKDTDTIEDTVKVIVLRDTDKDGNPDIKEQAEAAIEAAAKAELQKVEADTTLSEAEKANAQAEIEADKEKALEAVTNAVTPETVETAKEAGIAAIEADKSKLKAEVDKEPLVKQGDAYTKADADKQKAYDDAITEAKAVLAKENATQAEIDEALSKLKAAKESLENHTGGSGSGGSSSGGSSSGGSSSGGSSSGGSSSGGSSSGGSSSGGSSSGGSSSGGSSSGGSSSGGSSSGGSSSGSNHTPSAVNGTAPAPAAPLRPLDNVPKTEDASNLGLWVLLAVCSALSLGGLMMSGKRRKERYHSEHLK